MSTPKNLSLAERLRWHLQTAYIHHSVDGELYYITWGDRRPRHWLSTKPLEGPVPEEMKHGQLDGYMQVNHDDGRIYHRRTLPFTFWKVKTAHDQEPIDKDSDLFQDYVMFERWQL